MEIEKGLQYSEITFVNMKEQDFINMKSIRKYMGLENALSCIRNNYLWFANPLIWKDPFESWFINNKYNINGKNEEYPLKNKIYITCFTKLATCEAHWKTYSHNDIGISLEIDTEKLLKYLSSIKKYQFYIGKVMYKCTKDIQQKYMSKIPINGGLTQTNFNNTDLCVELLLLKRIAFSFEEEIRIFAIDKKKIDLNGINVKSRNYSIKNIIKTITMDPNMGKETRKILGNAFENEFPKNNFPKIKISKSALYRAPKNITVQ